MQLAVVATVCFALAGSPPVCRQEIVADSDMPIGLGCLIVEGQLDSWKEHSIYRGEQWFVSRVACVPGGYVPREPT